MKATCATINLGAVRRNAEWVSRLHPEVKMIAVVKADAYGHGSCPVSRAALRGGASMLAVAFSEEGKKLREEGITAPILILGASPESSCDEVVGYHLIQTVFDRAGVYALERAAADQGIVAEAHLKIETGMHRIGARPGEEIAAVLEALAECPHVRLTGAFSHLAFVEEPSGAYTKHQEKVFAEGIAQLKTAGYRELFIHLANSGRACSPETVPYDALRFGIALYGLSPLPEEVEGLEPALTWHTRVSYVKNVLPGESIGYGCSFTADRELRVATLPVGYADGYRRSLSGRGYVLIHGKKARILGRVCMDQCMVDVTDIPETVKGDAVVLLGRQGDEKITADLMAEWMETIHYEVLTGIGARVPRIYIDE